MSCFYQRNNVGMVLRRIETRIPTIEELNLPPIVKTLSMTKRGIIIFVGATGTGKSTSLAAMIGYRNQNSTGHIITIEDPIEFVHKHEGCIITQRELGIDTDSWENALKNTLRQAPDVIMIGEVRTRETMEHAVNFSETGHLCLCTLHANNANQAMDRILHFFPEDRHPQLFMDLSLNLKGVVAQQLIPTPDGKARRVAVEIMLGTPLVQDYIRQGEIHKLKEVMKESTLLGMKTFDQALFEAVSGRRDLLRGCVAFCRFVERGAPQDQARPGRRCAYLVARHGRRRTRRNLSLARHFVGRGGVWGVFLGGSGGGVGWGVGGGGFGVGWGGPRTRALASHAQVPAWIYRQAYSAHPIDRSVQCHLCGKCEARLRFIRGIAMRRIWSAWRITRVDFTRLPCSALTWANSFVLHRAEGVCIFQLLVLIRALTSNWPFRQCPIAMLRRCADSCREPLCAPSRRWLKTR